MARFPYHKKNISQLGKLLARARLDPEFGKEFQRDPLPALEKAGLPENVLSLISFKVIDAPDKNAVALPYRLNQRKLDAGDPAYLKSIGQTFSGHIN